MSYLEQDKEIKDFVRNINTVPGDVVNYAGPAQGDAWSQIIQLNSFGKKCLGKISYLNNSDYESEYSSDAPDSDSSYMSNSDGGNRRITKKKKLY